MKKKLYIKNEKGRYEEYVPEKPKDDSNLLYRKINGKYVPFSRIFCNDLSEGVWIVLSNLSCRSTTNSEYLKELFQIQKISGIEPVSIAQLGNLQQYAEYALHELNNYETEQRDKYGYNISLLDIIYFVVGKVFEFSKQQELKNQ